MGDEHFNYFGYGSNLLKERLQLMNPSAEFVDIGKLRVSVVWPTNARALYLPTSQSCLPQYMGRETSEQIIS